MADAGTWALFGKKAAELGKQLKYAKSAVIMHGQQTVSTRESHGKYCAQGLQKDLSR